MAHTQVGVRAHTRQWRRSGVAPTGWWAYLCACVWPGGGGSPRPRLVLVCCAAIRDPRHLAQHAGDQTGAPLVGGADCAQPYAAAYVRALCTPPAAPIVDLQASSVFLPPNPATLLLSGPPPPSGCAATPSSSPLPCCGCMAIYHTAVHALRTIPRPIATALSRRLHPVPLCSTPRHCDTDAVPTHPALTGCAATPPSSPPRCCGCTPRARTWARPAASATARTAASPCAAYSKVGGAGYAKGDMARLVHFDVVSL